jgi:hypothetical protein
MTQSTDDAYWRDLESNSHRPEVQELIGEEIQSGTIRVRPKGKSGICILPVHILEGGQPLELESPPSPPQDEASPSRKAPLSGRRARG